MLDRVLNTLLPATTQSINSSWNISQMYLIDFTKGKSEEWPHVRIMGKVSLNITRIYWTAIYDTVTLEFHRPMSHVFYLVLKFIMQYYA